MKRILSIVVLGIAGLVVALTLTVGALALAGDDLGDVVQPQLAPSPADSSRGSDDERSDGPSPGPSSSPSDDHGGSDDSDDSSGSGSDDSGTDDSSGHGSGSGDHSGDDD